MKKLLIPTFLLVLITASFSSCQKKDFSAEIKRVDSLAAAVEKSEQLFKTIVPEEVNQIRDKINADLDSAKTYLEKNKMTITPDDGLFFGRYKALTSSVDSFNALYNKIKNEIEKTHEQLNNLKTDLVNTTADPEKVNGYIKAEKNSVNTLNEAVANLVSVVQNLKDNAGPASENFAERMQNIVKTKPASKKK